MIRVHYRAPGRKWQGRRFYTDAEARRFVLRLSDRTQVVLGGEPDDRPSDFLDQGPGNQVAIISRLMICSAQTYAHERESEIARLITDDVSNREIAARPCLSERTVKTHVTGMFNKLGLNSKIRFTRCLASVSRA